MGRVIKETARRTADSHGFGCAKLVVFCNAVEDNPFMAGAFHGVSEADRVINVGVSGPGVVHHALQAVKGESFDVVAETIKKTAFHITRMGQLVAQEASRRLNVPFGHCGSFSGAHACRGRQRGPHSGGNGSGNLRHPRHHGGAGHAERRGEKGRRDGVLQRGRPVRCVYPCVSEDEGMIAAASSGVLTLDKLEAMTCVCSVGLDMIAVPGDTTADTLSAIIADEAAIGVVNTKTTAVRLIPAPGLAVGDTVDFGGLLGSAPIMPVHSQSAADIYRPRRTDSRAAAQPEKLEKRSGAQRLGANRPPAGRPVLLYLHSSVAKICGVFSCIPTGEKSAPFALT